MQAGAGASRAQSFTGRTTTEPCGQLCGRIKEVAERRIASTVSSAKLRKRTLGDYEICCHGHAEVRPSIANDHPQAGGWALTMGALAIRRPDPAVSTHMRESKAPTIVTWPNGVVGAERNVQILISQGSANNTIKTIGNDLHFRTTPTAEAHERVETLIDTDGSNRFVKHPRRYPQQL